MYRTSRGTTVTPFSHFTRSIRKPDSNRDEYLIIMTKYNKRTVRTSKVTNITIVVRTHQCTIAVEGSGGRGLIWLHCRSTGNFVGWGQLTPFRQSCNSSASIWSQLQKQCTSLCLPPPSVSVTLKGQAEGMCRQPLLINQTLLTSQPGDSAATSTLISPFSSSWRSPGLISRNFIPTNRVYSSALLWHDCGEAPVWLFHHSPTIFRHYNPATPTPSPTLVFNASFSSS